MAPARHTSEASIDAAYDDWKQADAAARAAADEVKQGWRRYDWGFGKPPSRELLARAAGLQDEATQKLGRAVQMLHETGRIQPTKPRRAKFSFVREPHPA